ncbi:trehalase isoform X1 [Leptopilina boulardi]|uniref:trehalase isoform X1 n=2 Tax=Leptopilina boulardi TaxID=63433 RepID=UPI0021F514F9|nr:trehalase isoform X1 [Leptopilina boulardi]XP_051173859.1 trehalase isoform X1 [Leptopilina boulardi]XP_051173860.1 trehalase isoform X1 [Leptopilina boulardi]XP_051173861.1 trehalase isoform X1 [Leptopilina boulardi]XP_051173862.1 trehalase isoform X1 [Leptopilina boulardi]
MTLNSRGFVTLLVQITIGILTILQILFVTAGQDTNSEKPLPCPSEIYCHGDLLHTVQMAKIFKDSKTFVDMKMKYSPNKTMSLFRELMSDTENNPTSIQVEEFLNRTFDPAGSEFKTWDPVDWKEEPMFLENIRDKSLKKFAKDLNYIWKLLGRQMKDEVKMNQEQYSIIYVPNPVIVPGGRFREFYYWDSYWIVKGLLLSEMKETVRGMLSNFVSIVERIGFIPNGGRIYYTQRSQPPMLIPMVNEYLKVTNDSKWLEENLWLLEKEFDFWMTRRTVQVKKDGVTYTLARYYEDSIGPRPESYREDYLTSQIFRTTEEKNNYYAELKTAAESGWDFSSRWFILEGTNKGNLTNSKARSIIPVDLNSIIYLNAQLLADFNRMVGNQTKSDYYMKKADEWRDAVTAVLWHNEVGTWLDYDIINEDKRDYFYPTNVLPLWTHCYDVDKKSDYVSKVLKYLEKQQIMLNLGGIPTTLEHSGEQWDYPNAWPPLQYFVIMSLDRTSDPWALRLAYELSQRWVRSNYKAFNETNVMFEKYDATVSGGYGGGGEYEVQFGFGWSNGIIMDLINKYGNQLTAEDHFLQKENPPESQVAVSTAGQLMTGILAIMISVAAGFIGMVVYKRRQYLSLEPATTYDKRQFGDAGNIYRKKIAYTELRDMSND